MFDYGPACEILARMKVFIVFAHAEPRSFNGAMFRTAQILSKPPAMPWWFRILTFGLFGGRQP